MDKEALLSALQQVKYPGFSRDIVSFGLIQGVEFHDGVASVSMEVTNADPTVPAQLKKSVEETLAGLDEVEEARVTVIVKKSSTPAANPTKAVPSTANLADVEHVVAIAS